MFLQNQKEMIYKVLYYLQWYRIQILLLKWRKKTKYLREPVKNYLADFYR